MIDRFGIEAREYKLLLDPNRFAGEPSEKMANVFWEKKLKPIIGEHLDHRNEDRDRYKKRFISTKKRIVQYWDTEPCLLTRCDYALRERVDVVDAEEGESRKEVTLKLRTPDLFIAASTSLPGSQADATTKFEEDIAPLEVPETDRSGKQSVAFAEPRSIRSRFSLSTKQSVACSKRFKSLANVLELYPTLERNLKANVVGAIKSNAGLCHGPVVREVVFDGAEVDLGDDIDGEFALTLWTFEPATQVSGIGEISFKCEIEGGRMPGGAARRALKLFVAMQKDLGDWVNFRDVSKTTLALPWRCSGQRASQT